MGGFGRGILIGLSAAVCAAAGRWCDAADVLRVPEVLPELEQRGSWRETLEDLASYRAPDSWLILGPVPDPDRKRFDQRGALEAERSDDWGKLNPRRWTRPADEESCEVDLSDLSVRKRDALVFAQTEVDWPVAGPALLWFDANAYAVVYVNNARVEYAKLQKRKHDPRVALYPVPAQMLRGRNIIKLKLAQTEERRVGLVFHLRLERNDLAYRERLLTKLRALYPAEAAGWRGAEALLELARRHEEAGNAKEALALCGKLSETFPDDSDAMAEVQAARQRLERPPDGKSEDGDAAWRAAGERFEALVKNAETVAADRVLREFAAYFPLSRQTGLALCLRGALRQDYGLSEGCQRFFERALREFGQDEEVRERCLRGLAFARSYHPETPEVAVRHELQLQVDAVRRQLTGGNAADAEAAVRSVDTLMRVSGDSILRVSDSLFTPRYAGVREYLRALLAHLGSEPLALYRKMTMQAAEQRYQAAKATGSVLDLEAAAWEHYLTPAAAKALNRAGNHYLDYGAYAQAAAIFRLLLRDYRAAGGTVQSRGDGAILGDLSEAVITAKLARALMRDGQASAAREALSSLRRHWAGAQLMAGGRLVTGAEYASNLEARLTWAALSASGTALAAESETFGGNTRRAGPGLLSPAPKPGATAWHAALAKSASAETAQRYWPEAEDKLFAHLQSYPIITGGRVVVSTLEGLQSVEWQSGQAVWKQAWSSSGSLSRDRFTGFPISCPTACNERVYLRVLAGDRTALRCYRAADGKLSWSTEAAAAHKKTVWLSDPLVAYGLAIAVFVREPPQEESGMGRGGYNLHGVAALDAETGEARWERPLATGVTGIRVFGDGRGGDKQYTLCRGSMQLGPPAADGGVVYAVTGLGSLAALNAFTGEVLWLSGYARLRVESVKEGNAGATPFLPRLVKLNARGPCSPVVADEVVVLAPKDAPGVLAFDRRNGQVRWSHDLLDCRFLAGACEGNVIAADSTVSALSLATGKAVWEFSLEGKRLLGQPGFSGGTLYLPLGNSLVLVDARTGKAVGNYAWDQKAGPLANLVVTGQGIAGVNAKYVSAIKAGDSVRPQEK